MDDRAKEELPEPKSRQEEYHTSKILEQGREDARKGPSITADVPSPDQTKEEVNYFKMGLGGPIEDPDRIKLEARRLSFVFPSGEELNVDLVEFKLQLEEYTEGKANFREFRDDVINLIETEYKIKASITEAWQVVQAVEAVWEEFKKKVLEQQTLLLGITLTPSASLEQN